MLAATFNPALAYDYARSIGEECRAGGVEVLLGPGLNIYRNSQCGRNFEYFGEDPFLTSRITENYVQGMQSTGTAACLKHFLANNTEFYRRRSNSILDERTMREIYLPGFEAGIAAGVACVMTSYNRINGEWAGQSKEVITDSAARRTRIRRTGHDRLEFGLRHAEADSFGSERRDAWQLERGYHGTGAAVAGQNHRSRHRRDDPSADRHLHPVRAVRPRGRRKVQTRTAGETSRTRSRRLQNELRRHRTAPERRAPAA
ncbi:MAG: glycoside hydrolase family 3 protein [Alistipes onderdonkii]